MAIKKPNIAFLEKVRDGKVYHFFSYTQRRGGYHGFTGGEKSYEAHRAAGFVNRYGVADLGRPAYVTLTDAGKAALAEHGIPAEKPEAQS